jgi:hypothetical protein
VKRSSNRAAYPSSGPGAGGHATGFVIAHHRLQDSPGNYDDTTAISLDSTNYR